MIAETLQKIQGIPTGKTLSIRSAEYFAHVRKTDSTFEVECGWVVSEAHDDDYDSYTYHPFDRGNNRSAMARPWVGRKFVTESAERATEVYEAYKAAVLGRTVPTIGLVIGSVVR